MPIKKPWKIISWNIDFPELHLRCETHERVECAGRETKQTQTYTPVIVAFIMDEVNKHVKKIKFGTDLNYEALSRDDDHPNDSICASSSTVWQVCTWEVTSVFAPRNGNPFWENL